MDDLVEVLVGRYLGQYVLLDGAVVADDVVLGLLDGLGQHLHRTLQRTEDTIFVVLESEEDVSNPGGLGGSVALEHLFQEHPEGDYAVSVVEFGLADGAEQAALGAAGLDADEVEGLTLVRTQLIAAEILHADGFG